MERNIDMIMSAVMEATREEIHRRFQKGYYTDHIFESEDGGERRRIFDVNDKIWMACDLADLDEKSREVVCAAAKVRSVPLKDFESLTQCHNFLQVLLPTESDELKQKIARLSTILFNALQ